MRQVLLPLLVAASFLLAAGAYAQQPADPVMAAYRDYQAAQKANDLAGAEAAAERAWRASEARDGDGGKTAVLAFNAALARLAATHAAAAVEPARRALTLAEKGAVGVNPVRARLVLGQALVVEDYRQAKPILLAALEEARKAGTQERLEAYKSAVALANQASSRLDWPAASQAWRIALDNMDGELAKNEILRVQALAGRGIALAAQGDDSALQPLLQAVHMLAPYAAERQDDQITRSEQYYAETFGWLQVVAARMRAKSKRVPDLALARPGIAGKAPLCSVEVQIDPKPPSPVERGDRYGFASFTLKLKTDSAGHVLHKRFLASTPDNNVMPEWMFGKAQWTLKPADDAAAGCRMESADHIATLTFLR